MCLSLALDLSIGNRNGGSAPPDPNILAPLDWEAGSNTTLSIVGNEAQGAAIGTNNPRVLKGPVELAAGTYRYQGKVFIGTTPGGARFRVSSDPDLASSHVVDVTFGVDTDLNDTFVIVSPGPYYVGVVGIGNSDGQYIAIATDFSLTVEP